MASTQQEQQAEAAAKLAAKDLCQVNRERESDLGAADQQKRGVIGSVMRAVQDTYENAKEAVVGKKDPAKNSYTTEVVHDVNVQPDDVATGEVRDISATKSPGICDSASDKAGSEVGEYTDCASQKAKGTKDATKQKAGEYTDYASGKAKETKDATEQKAGECADYASQKAKEAKDRTMEKGGEYKEYAAEKAKEGKDATVNKMGEYKDYTAEKAKEGKDTTTGKLGELKDSAADAAKRAMGYLSGKKEETKEKAAETAEATKNKTAENAEAATNKAVEMKDAAKDKAAETTEAAKQKTAEAKEKTKENVSGADEAARRKMEELRLQGKGYGEECEGRGDKVVFKVEESRSGAMAETLKAADQIAGQTFNDVGRLDEEGVVSVDRRKK
ncbi:Embryonic protein DC-8 [Spatholobus suberectus]|nr:Embryonic protein DC-8 [Spatholobus suberectus]